MKIVFHYPHPLPVIGYGGIERILFWHMKELVRLGHNVVLIGHPKSLVEQFGIELIRLHEGVKDWELLIPKSTDIVHLSYNAETRDFPTINTVHGNGKIGESFKKNSVFVSKKHGEIHGSSQFVHNAIDFSEYPFPLREEKKLHWEKFLFLAKASWRVKNLSDAVKSCRASHKHLEVCGGRWWGWSRFIHNHGMVDGPQKLKIMQSCDALIFPVRWHEPFGIAVIEAMSQGIPVIGSRYGSLPEIITSTSGILTDSYAKLLVAIQGNENHFDPLQIRAYVESKFNITNHAESYLSLYKEVVDGKALNLTNPTYQFKSRAEELLPF